jgi:hypothetical protein
MSGSYRQCSECGKRALSIATRCPGCGRELPRPSHPGRRSLDLGRFLTVPAMLGVLAAGAVLAASWEARRRSAIPEESSFVAGGPRGESPAEPAREVPSPLASAPLAATPRLDPATGGRGSARSPASPTRPAVSIAADTGYLLVARTWTHVRNRRSVKGGLEAVLMPGDTVEADSLSRGWYRVALDGEVMGYAHASTLTGAGSPQP